MLKAAFLPEDENALLQKELRVEYIKMDYLCFINELMFFMRSHPSFTQKVSYHVFLVLNKILLDNIFKHVTQKSSDLILHQLSHKTFSKDIFINNFYTSQLLEAGNIAFPTEESLIDKHEIENGLSKMLYNYLDHVYTSNRDNLDTSILRMFEYMNNHLHFLNISYYKFELMETRKPILLYTEREPHVFNQHHQ